MSLASAGDFSNVHMCMPDVLDMLSGTTGTEDKPGKDAVCFEYAKGITKDYGNSFNLLTLKLVIIYFYSP